MMAADQLRKMKVLQFPVERLFYPTSLYAPYTMFTSLIREWLHTAKGVICQHAEIYFNTPFPYTKMAYLCVCIDGIRQSGLLSFNLIFLIVLLFPLQLKFEHFCLFRKKPKAGSM